MYRLEHKYKFTSYLTVKSSCSSSSVSWSLLGQSLTISLVFKVLEVTASFAKVAIFEFVYRVVDTMVHNTQGNQRNFHFLYRSGIERRHFQHAIALKPRT